MCTHGRIKKYTKMWVYGRYEAPAYPTRYPDKVHRHPSDTRFEKWKYLTLISMRKYISLSPFWIFSTKKHWRNTHSRKERNKRAWYSESNVKCVIRLNLKFSNLVDASSRHSRQNRCPHLVCKGSRRGKLQIQHWKSSSTTLTKFSW